MSRPVSSASLRELFDDAARGVFPPGDFRTTHLPSPETPADAVCMFFAHHVIASDVASEFVTSWTSENPFALSDVRFLAALAHELGTEPGIYDAVFAAAGSGKSPDDVAALLGLFPTDDHSHPRVQRAYQYRSHETIRVFTDAEQTAVLVLGRGVAGRLEAAYEVEPEARGKGLGTRCIQAARLLAPTEEALFVQIAPGNVWSMRALEHDRGHWRCVGGEVLFLRR